MTAQRKAPGGAKPKHVPQRTCIACRQVAGKRSLMRLVRTESGVVEMDPTGKKAGRGAYLHPYQVCWRAVLRGNRLEQALRAKLNDTNRQTLLAYMATLPESEAAESDETESKAVTTEAGRSETAKTAEPVARKTSIT